jgi:prepilin-type N-terminal cleavage/methylation domain-containing protein
MSRFNLDDLSPAELCTVIYGSRARLTDLQRMRSGLHSPELKRQLEAANREVNSIDVYVLDLAKRSPEIGWEIFNLIKATHDDSIQRLSQRIKSVLPITEGATTSRRGFTIVELLIVIVVIAILAAITIVAYNGIQNRARIASLQSNLGQMAKGLEVYKVSNSDTYPVSLAAGNIKTPDTGTYTYQSNGSSYCLSGATSGISYRVTNTTPNPSEGSCSGVLADGSTCPTGFIVVPGNSTFGTSDFCTMKYEAKIAGQSNGNQGYSSAFVPESRADGTPWVNISQTNATAESSTVAGCSGCHLISEAEWMTIAANVLSVPSNWSGGSVGSGYIFSGHNDNTPGNSLAASTDDDGYNGTGNTAGQTATTNGVQGNAQRRTLTLTNGEVIWDFPGNVWEWTTGTIAGGQQPGLSGEAYAWKQWNNPSLLMNGLPVLSRPSAISLTVAGYSSTQGIGQLLSNYGEAGARSFLRGGYWSSTSITGVLTLYLDTSAGSTNYGIGFRVSR